MFTTQAARDAVSLYGAEYAQYVEEHTLELISKGHLPEREGMTRDLGAALAGNEGI